MTQEDEDYFLNEYYTYNIRFFKFIGLSPYKIPSLKMIHVCFFNFIIAIGLFIQIFMLVTLEMKINSITKLLETTVPCLCFTLCYYNLLSKVTIIKKLLIRIKIDWDKLTNKSELNILEGYANRSRQCTITIAIAFYLYIAILILPSVIRFVMYIFGILDQTELVLPISIDYFLKDRAHFYFALFNDCTSLIILSTIGIAHSSIFVSLIQHVCALFHIVEWKIEKGYEWNSHNFSHTHDSIKYDEEFEWIINIIEYYDNAIDFVNLIKLYQGKIYVFEMFFAILIVIIDYIYLFQILSFTISISEGLQKSNYIIASMFVIYVYCYLGQKLIDHHTDVSAKFCQIPFYLLSLKTQKMLPFMIMKSMMSCNLSIKGVIVLSHYLFATSMRTLFSYSMMFYKSSSIENE